MATPILSSCYDAVLFWVREFRQFRVEWRVRRSLRLALENRLA